MFQSAIANLQSAIVLGLDIGDKLYYTHFNVNVKVVYIHESQNADRGAGRAGGRHPENDPVL